MAANAKTLTVQLQQCGWTLVRTPVNAASGWHRWRLWGEDCTDPFAFHRLDEVERFWQGCFHAQTAAATRARVMAAWCVAEGDERGDAVRTWLDSGTTRMPAFLRDAVRETPIAALPIQWRKHALATGRLAAPAGIDLHRLVRDELAMAEGRRLAAVLPATRASAHARRL